MKLGARNWLLVCPSCGFLRSTLMPSISKKTGSATIDESKHADGLGKLRQSNFQRILTRLSALSHAPGKRLLEVGCAHGWFLKAAMTHGFEVFGLEPDSELSALAKETGLRI
jgi:cyclopropane fatty-acyl-phospholipid synthase-like methyltransferase